ncbi:MAG: nuclear transport factor 2 family protein [Cyclobacteriaceae bacterium]|nr:nuclear transport factor 2 family protein [Cyclobacteriaceae bacterium]
MKKRRPQRIRYRYVFLLFAAFVAKASFGQAPDQKNNPLTSFFTGITGTWQASPADNSFVSRLEYRKGEDKFFLMAGNTLMSKEGKIFTEYEGAYFYNPALKNIGFTTINKNEIHTGTCKVSGDTLFHFAQLSGSARVKSYTSAIVKKDGNTLLYYASYSETENVPVLKFEQPLIYRKKAEHANNGAFISSQENTIAKNIDTARKSFAAFNLHNWEEHASCFSDTCKYLDPSYGKEYRVVSRREKIEKYKQMEQRSPDIKDSITSIFGVGDKVVIQFISSGTAGTGQKWRLPICCVFTFKDGLIVKDETYYDRGN